MYSKAALALERIEALEDILESLVYSRCVVCDLVTLLPVLGVLTKQIQGWAGGVPPLLC